MPFFMNILIPLIAVYFLWNLEYEKYFNFSGYSISTLGGEIIFFIKVNNSLASLPLNAVNTGLYDYNNNLISEMEFINENSFLMLGENVLRVRLKKIQIPEYRNPLDLISNLSRMQVKGSLFINDKLPIVIPFKTSLV